MYIKRKNNKTIIADSLPAAWDTAAGAVVAVAASPSFSAAAASYQHATYDYLASCQTLTVLPA